MIPMSVEKLPVALLLLIASIAWSPGVAPCKAAAKASAPPPHTLYVDAVRGADSSPGTAQKPFRTLSKAVRLLSPGNTLIVNEGVYEETVTVPPGTAGKPVVIKAAPGAQPVISGSTTIGTTWRIYKDKIYVANVSALVENLFVDGRQLNLARWPDTRVDELNTMARSTMEKGSDSRQIVDAHLPRVDLTGARVNLWPGSAYNAHSRVIQAYKPGASLTFDSLVSSSGNDPEGYDPFVPIAGNKYYIVGALELLDAPGEWYYDAAAAKLYLYTEGGDDPSKHKVAYQTRVTGLDMSSAEFATVAGISLVGCAVNADGARNCTLDGVNVKYGDYFIDGNSYESISHRDNILGGSGNVWKNSTISKAAGNGLCLAGSNNTVDNCTIFDVDWSGGYSANVSVEGTGNTVRNSSLYNSGRFVIYHSKAKQVRILNNEIYGSAMLTNDCGAIYAWGTEAEGTEIAFNYIHDNIGVGIYIDNNCSGMLVHHNIASRNGTGITMNSQALDCVIVNNTFVGNKLLMNTYNYAADIPSMKGSLIANNLFAGNWKLITGANAPIAKNNVRAGTLGPDFSLPDGHIGIDAGTIVAPYTDGFRGVAPDAGALEKGAAPFKYGASGKAR